jgi:hypothetical protein
MPRSSAKSPAVGAQSAREYRKLQRITLDAIIRPLTPKYQMQRTWKDGRPTAAIVEQFIKPNDRLTSFERIEIYNRQYWFRLLDCLYDDYPGLRAILGDPKFRRLRVAYLEHYPSNSFTLRDLGSRLVQFLIERPELTHPHEEIALDMARFEWAQVVAFDGLALPAVSVDELLGVNPAKLRLQRQPYLTLLKLHYPLDDFVIALKKRDAAMRGEASNAVDTSQDKQSKPQRRPRLPKRQQIFLVVHRHDNALYYKRLEPQAYALLQALQDGKSLAKACEIAVKGANGAGEKVAAKIGDWFNNWAALGWFCKAGRQNKSPGIRRRKTRRSAL